MVFAWNAYKKVIGGCGCVVYRARVPAMALSLSPLRRRVLLALLAAVFIPCGVLALLSEPDAAQERALALRLAEIQARLQHLDALHRARRVEEAGLTARQGSLTVASGGGGGDGGTAVAASRLNASGVAGGANVSSNLRPHELVASGGRGGVAVAATPGTIASGAPGGSNLPSAVAPLETNPKTSLLLRNLTSLAMRPARSLPPLRFPSVYSFLPHLLGRASSLRPAFCLSRGRSGVSVVLGIPTVKRELQSYLMATLQNLVDNMTPEEAEDTLIVVLIAETDRKYVLQMSKQLQTQFGEQVESGLIEVVSPPAAYYPDMQSLRPTLEDPPERVRWRSKQNLDFAYLMMYAQPKGIFYVQLEDDILAKKNYISTMKKYALEKISEKSPWFVLEFCQLGFIGKMFKSVELPWLVQFFFMFYNDKPVDWLLDHFISTKICRVGEDDKHCRKAKEQLWLQYKPSLFQHIGTCSSLKGKVQELKDNQFGEISLFIPHKNPKARVESTIKHYKQYSLPKAYAGETFFWGLLPHPGDDVVFRFTNPTNLTRYLFRSGNAEHPSDIFYNTTVEVLHFPSQIKYNKSDFNSTSDGFIIVGQFNSMGIAEGTIDSKFGPIKELRLKVHSDSKKWAILSEIHIMPANGSFQQCSCCSTASLIFWGLLLLLTSNGK